MFYNFYVSELIWLELDISGCLLQIVKLSGLIAYIKLLVYILIINNMQLINMQ